MKINKVKLVYFSPTGGCKAVAVSIGNGLGLANTELLDLTYPANRGLPQVTGDDELLVIVVPVYMGRVPAVLQTWFSSFRAGGSPAVCVVVYGNRTFDNALLELRDLLADRGCKPIAGAAFIAEHSFSVSGFKTAAGRPEASDLLQAEKFGELILNKLYSAETPDDVTLFTAPGVYPYGGVTELWSVDFISVSQACEQCGLCAAYCPVGAITPGCSSSIDHEKCITCCACIKYCPRNARSMKDSPVKDAAVRLNSLYTEQKLPELFL